MLDLSRLSDEQRQAVLAGDGPMLIVAGPGSGKTTLLAARIAYLVASRQIPPTSVLAIAFATKAARELRSRLANVLGGQGSAVDVTTFHAFGFRIVRQWSEELGFGPGPLAVYGESDVYGALREVMERAEVNITPPCPPPDLVRRLELYRLDRNSDLQMADELGRLATVYEGLLQRRGAVDYPAMIALPLRLFDMRPNVLRLYQDSYRYILCDEFQDVCAAQYLLLRRLVERHRNLVVVGDPRQTLYGWRGADDRFLLDFRRDFPEARIVSLDQNFRSTARIVDVANVLGEALPYSRPLWTENPQGERVLLHFAPDEDAEAAFVASEIEQLLAEQSVRCPAEIAVLYRTNQQVHALMLALHERHLPYRVHGGGDLFACREVRDVVAYLRLAHNPADSAALARIANVPPRQLGCLVGPLRDRPVPVLDLPALARSHGRTVATKVTELAELIETLHSRSRQLPPTLLLDLVVEETGYGRWLRGQRDGQARLANLATLRALVERAEGDLGAWLAELQMEGKELHTPDGSQCVLLTTIHGAKGGEWRVVFVIGVEEGLLPHIRSMAARAPEDSGLADELRVAYVAVTRPRERLYLTCCRSRKLGERTETRYPSRFLQRLPVTLLERVA